MARPTRAIVAPIETQIAPTWAVGHTNAQSSPQLFEPIAEQIGTTTALRQIITTLAQTKLGIGFG